MIVLNGDYPIIDIDGDFPFRIILVDFLCRPMDSFLVLALVFAAGNEQFELIVGNLLDGSFPLNIFGVAVHNLVIAILILIEVMKLVNERVLCQGDALLGDL